MSLEDLNKLIEQQNQTINQLQSKAANKNQFLNNGTTYNQNPTSPNRKEILANIREQIVTCNSQNNGNSIRQKTIETMRKYSTEIVSEIENYIQNNSLELIFVIDKSYSCSGIESQTIRGFDYTI